MLLDLNQNLLRWRMFAPAMTGWYQSRTHKDATTCTRPFGKSPLEKDYLRCSQVSFEGMIDSAVEQKDLRFLVNTQFYSNSLPYILATAMNSPGGLDV